MSGIVFINYRRKDAEHVAGRLFDRLERAFSSDQLFFDVDNIPPGEDFVAYLNAQVDACDVLVALVGPAWESQLDKQDYGPGRQTKDFVRIEIEAALSQGKKVIPVLVSGAEMPREDDLPESLRPFSRRNAVRLSHERFRADAAGLTNALKAALAEADERRAAATAARAAEDEAEKVAAQANAAAPGLSPEQIAKAEELAHWDFIKDTQAAQDLKDHLTRYPSGVTAPMALAKLEAVIWNGLGQAPSIEVLETFLKNFPDGKHAATALAKLNLLHQAEAAQRAKQDRAQAKRPATDAPREKSERSVPQDAADGQKPGKRVWPLVAGGVFAVLAIGAVVIQFSRDDASGPAVPAPAPAERPDAPSAAEPAPAEPSPDSEPAPEAIAPGPLDDIVLGDADAPNTIIEYASMTCPHCARFHQDVFPKVKENYIDTGKARFVFREFPLDGLAAAASMLARCAGEGGFYPTLDHLFSTQETWAVPGEDGKKELAKIAKQMGVSQEAFDTCLADKALLDKLTAGRKKAHEDYGVSAVPTFFVNGKRLGGVALEDFEAALGAP